MGFKVLLVLCLFALLNLVWPVLAQFTDDCATKPTINEEGVKTFESFRKQYEQALASRPTFRDFIQRLQSETVLDYELMQYFQDVCPSKTVIAKFYSIPYQSGYTCWTLQPVLYTKCSAATCQNWDGVPWVSNYKFMCKEKYVHEHIWSYCVNDKREQSFLLIKEIVLLNNYDDNDEISD